MFTKILIPLKSDSLTAYGGWAMIICMRQMIRLLRGLPASGKTSYAVALIEDPQWIRIERDQLRDQLYGTRHGLSAHQEQFVTSMQFSMAHVAITSGKSVVISDMNLRASYVRQWAKFAAQRGIEFNVVKFYVPIDELILRDRQRVNSVGEAVIRELAARFTKNGVIADIDISKELGNTFVYEPYVADESKPKAILVDIDGTLTKMNGRSPYEWMRVGEDSLVEAVVEAVNAAHAAGMVVIVMSGRDSVCREITIDSLNSADGPKWDHLFMRAEGDTRKDDIVKYELFNNHVRNNYNVRWVYDDRPQVCRMWRKLGLFVFQVGDPYTEF